MTELKLSIFHQTVFKNTEQHALKPGDIWLKSGPSRGGGDIPWACDIWGGPSSLRNTKYTRMCHFDKKN